MCMDKVHLLIHQNIKPSGEKAIMHDRMKENNQIFKNYVLVNLYSNNSRLFQD